ncbi:MAG: hypothetical protein HYT30_02290 [Parcubacteria group bacterium]|nr:hypothetical protein [Parcubacteria group bacterium]
MAGKIMYCAIPTRIRDRADKARAMARQAGYSPVIPFDVGPYEDFEGGQIGRERTLDFMIKIQRNCDVLGFFGVSDGTMGELKDALDRTQHVRVFRGLDDHWDSEYYKYKMKWGDLLARLTSGHPIIVLVGTSAVGKSYWIDRLLARFQGKLHRVKNTTTRQKRDEWDEQSYRFISKEDFKRGIEEGAFFEWDSYLGEYYGSSITELQEVLQHSAGVFALTPPGARALYERRGAMGVALIHMVPATDEVLIRNFERRGIDQDKHAQLIAAAKSFTLPPTMIHATIPITGDTPKDIAHFEKVFATLLVK